MEIQLDNVLMYFDARFIYEHADDDNMKVCVNFVLSENIFDFIFIFI